MIQLLLAVADSLPGFVRVPVAGRADQGVSPVESESSVAVSAAGSGDRPGAEEEYCDITLPLILYRRRRENEAR